MKHLARLFAWGCVLAVMYEVLAHVRATSWPRSAAPSKIESVGGNNDKRWRWQRERSAVALCVCVFRAREA